MWLQILLSIFGCCQTGNLEKKNRCHNFLIDIYLQIYIFFYYAKTEYVWIILIAAPWVKFNVLLYICKNSYKNWKWNRIIALVILQIINILY